LPGRHAGWEEEEEEDEDERERVADLETRARASMCSEGDTTSCGSK